LSSVPETVKNNADIVVHRENTDVDIQGVEKFTMKVDRIFTVLNENAKADLVFKQYSSKNISLEDAEIKVYDAGGNKWQSTGKRHEHYCCR
jgi:hypothetical protein